MISFQHKALSAALTSWVCSALLIAEPCRLKADDNVKGSDRPNVLFIVADDLGWGDLGCYGNTIVDTPTINGLAGQGVRLTNCYSPSPLCAPARAGLLTGRFNHRTGAVDVPSNRGLDRIALSEKTFGDLFRGAGYQTAYIGKWHNGLYCADYLPHRRGFDSFVGFPNGGQDYWKWNLLSNDNPMPHDGRYLSDVFNDEAIRLIKQHAGTERRKPLAIFLAHHAPHQPLQAPKDLVEKYRQRLQATNDPVVARNEKVATIYAMIEAMDSGLGRVFKTLREHNLWDNTIVVFTSDNGAQVGRMEGKSVARFCGGFKGNKGDVGEQGIRVPGIISWSGHIAAQRQIDNPFHGCDWLPTLLSAAGVTDVAAAKPSRPFDGLDMMPLLRRDASANESVRDLMFQKNRYWPVGHSDAAIRRGKWKLVWPGISVTMRKDSPRDNPSYLRGLRQPHWQMPLDLHLKPFASIEEAPPRLYDLSVDPSEKNDLAAAKRELVSKLTSSYDQWFSTIMVDWNRARQEIVAHDRAYWKDRRSPDAARLFRDHWQWQRAPKGTDPRSADPLAVFNGFWSEGAR